MAYTEEAFKRWKAPYKAKRAYISESERDDDALATPAFADVGDALDVAINDDDDDDLEFDEDASLVDVLQESADVESDFEMATEQFGSMSAKPKRPRSVLETPEEIGKNVGSYCVCRLLCS